MGDRKQRNKQNKFTDKTETLEGVTFPGKRIARGRTQGPRLRVTLVFCVNLCLVSFLGVVEIS